MPQRAAFMRGHVIALVALDLVLRILGRGAVRVALVVEIADMHGDYRAGHMAGLGIPPHMVADLEWRDHRLHSFSPYFAVLRMPMATACGDSRHRQV